MPIKKINKSVELKSGKLKSKTFIVTREELHPPPIQIPDIPFNLNLESIVILSNVFFQSGIYTFTLKMRGHTLHNLKVRANDINGLNRQIGEAIGNAFSQISSQFNSEIVNVIKSKFY